MNHPLQCRCGKLKGRVDNPRATNRGICYCKDCQAFAHFLRHAEDILDADGGTQVVQTIPANVTFTAGQEHLACMRLKENGLLRWYASCCNTPIGNTLANFRMSFVGLVHSCLTNIDHPLTESFGPVRMWVHTGSAKTKVVSRGLLRGMLRLSGNLVRARIDGSYKRTPFFDVGTGAPAVAPKVLSREELTAVLSRL